MSCHSLVTIQNLYKSYHLEHGRVQALKGIDLIINSHESVAIMGPSGSGKSTLLHLLGCLDKPTSGKYLLNNQDISLLDDQTLSLTRATKIGFVFQSYNLIPQLNLLENLKVPFLYQSPRLSEEEIHQRILKALEQVGLRHRLYHLPSQLSGGEAQRAAIARALSIRPLLILADEPTGNLDRETGHKILALFEELHLQGSTLIIVTHDVHVAAHCQRILHMQDGSVKEGSTYE